MLTGQYSGHCSDCAILINADVKCFAYIELNLSMCTIFYNIHNTNQRQLLNHRFCIKIKIKCTCIWQHNNEDENLEIRSQNMIEYT